MGADRIVAIPFDIEKGAGGVSTIPLTAGEKGLSPLSLALEQPAFGQLRGADELRKRGLVVPPAGVRLRVAGLGADRGPVWIDVGGRAAIAIAIGECYKPAASASFAAGSKLN